MSIAPTMVFCEKPQVVYVDEDHSVKPPAYSTITQLIKSLKDNGPLVAVGKMGPNAYTEAPFKLKDKVNNNDIYGWRPRTAKAGAPLISVILSGARQTESNAYVYFTLAKDITRDNDSLIRGYKPADTDTKVYIVSYKSFLERSLTDLHPICPFGNWLFSVNAASILRNKTVTDDCNLIGQLIFNHYKAAAQGESQAGADALVRICDAAVVLTQDGRIRKSNIERAWHEVGDENYCWQA